MISDDDKLSKEDIQPRLICILTGILGVAAFVLISWFSVYMIFINR